MSDDLIEQEFNRHHPSQWRSFANDNTVLRCCRIDFGNATRKVKRGDDERAWRDWFAHLRSQVEPIIRAQVLSEAADLWSGGPTEGREG